jgi:ketosteroid isomerase-like protein
MILARWMAIFLGLAMAAGAQAPAETATSREVTGMLRQFLVDAGNNNRAGFEKFFADDVIYTRSAGVVITKADILKSLDSAKPPTDTKSIFSAEDITVHEYGDTAVVAFRLVAHTEHSDGKVETDHYRNTGTFLRRSGKWQVIAWQATKIPEVPAAK